MKNEIEEVKVGYGPRKLDAEAYAKQKAAKALSGRGGTKYGKRKEQPAPPAPSTGDETTKSTPPTVPPSSLAQLEQALARRPLLLDAAIAAEFQRAEGPRKGAIELFMKHENTRRGGPRLEVIAKLTGEDPADVGDGGDDDGDDEGEGSES